MPVNGAERYTPADFHALRTAHCARHGRKGAGLLLIVTGTNGGERGLGAATGKCVDRRRAHRRSESTDARTALARITAAEVAYIDIVERRGSQNVPG